jgi:hypothetical protein
VPCTSTNYYFFKYIETLDTKGQKWFIDTKTGHATPLERARTLNGDPPHPPADKVHKDVITQHLKLDRMREIESGVFACSGTTK